MLKTLLLTGAAGGVGQSLRPLLSQIAESVVLSDLTPMKDLRPSERFVACDLSDRSGVDALVNGVDGIIHLGGISVEKPFDQIMQGNILGLYNLYEAARAAGRPRIVFASSNHTIGFYRRDERIDTKAPARPDSLYGVSKVFGEAVASLYFDKFGQETLSVRIGSCFPEPRNTRMMATWFSPRDFLSLCGCAFDTPRLGHTIIYGVSDNDEQWWDNSHAAFLGWRPQDNAAHWRREILSKTSPDDPNDPAVVYQGGGFVTATHPED